MIDADTRVAVTVALGDNAHRTYRGRLTHDYHGEGPVRLGRAYVADTIIPAERVVAVEIIRTDENAQF